MPDPAADYIRATIDALEHERRVAARSEPLENRLLGGPRLFEAVCERMRAGIRAQFPHAASGEVEEILRQRLQTNRRVENAA